MSKREFTKYPYHVDSYKKHRITDEELDFLQELQKEMNTQHTWAQADPRIWVIQEPVKKYLDNIETDLRNDPDTVEILNQIADGAELYIDDVHMATPQQLYQAIQNIIKGDDLGEKYQVELIHDYRVLIHGRNDLGKISKFGSVDVTKYMMIHRYSKIMHICSQVESEIESSKDGLDAIEAVLPAGTLSGAPKIRAMEIINELENNKRGIYGGAIGYIDFTGNLDTCIAIRIAYKKNGKVFVRSGAGIVADSVPVSEYNECLNKARAVMNAVNESDQLD